MPKDKLPRRAWAVLEENDDLAAHDGRLPLFWFRPVARFFINEHLAGEARIVRVEVREVQRKKAKP